VTFTRATTSTVLDVQIPWLQFEKSDKGTRVFSTAVASDNEDVFLHRPPSIKEPVGGDVNILRREIMEWFDALGLHMSKVVRASHLLLIFT
jgi:hypothetical protein